MPASRLYACAQLCYALPLTCCWQDTIYYRYSTSSTRALDVSYQTKQAQAAQPDLEPMINDMLVTAAANLAALAAVFQNALSSKATTQVDGIFSQLPTAASLLNGVNQTLSYDTPAHIAQAFQVMQSNLNMEILNKETARAASADRIANTLTAITTANTNDFRDTAAIVTEDYTYRQGLVTSISGAVASFSSQQSTIAATKSSALVTASASTTASISSSLSTSLTSEASRAYSRAVVIGASVSPKLSITTGSTDRQTWYDQLPCFLCLQTLICCSVHCSTTAQAGQFYYSSGTSNLWYCGM
jgi:hypothetical protein